MTYQETGSRKPTQPSKPFLTSRTAEWLLATAMGFALVKTATLSGVAELVVQLPWAEGFGSLLTFIAPDLDNSAPWIAGVVLGCCAFFISSAANPRDGFGWWTLDIFIAILGIFILGPWVAGIIVLIAGAGGLATARARGEYWPMVLLNRFVVWAVMGLISYLVIWALTSAAR